MEKTQVFFRRI